MVAQLARSRCLRHRDPSCRGSRKGADYGANEFVIVADDSLGRLDAIRTASDAVGADAWWTGPSTPRAACRGRIWHVIGSVPDGQSMTADELGRGCCPVRD